MHIVHLLPELKQGGIETVVVGLNREQTNAGHQLTVISAGGPMSKTIEQDGGRHIQLDVCSKNPLTLPVRIIKLRNILAKLQPDILHVHSRVPAWICWFANKRLHIPFITTVHGFNSVSKYSEIMTKGDRVICVSHPVKKYILENYPVTEKKIDVVHGGIDPEKFNPAEIDPEAIEQLKARLGFDNKIIISSVGRITELKDYETFIRAIKIASDKNPAICGLIVGHVRQDKQQYFERLKNLIHELNLNGIVQIATDLTDIPAVYALSNLVISGSKKPESFGLTLIEALAMNTPVAATRHGGPLDIIQEGINGVFFAPVDPEDLANTLSDALRLSSGEFRESTINTFSLQKMADGNIKVYEKACTC